MSKATTTTLTYVNFANATSAPLQQPDTIFVTWTSVVTDSNPSVPPVTSTNTYSLTVSSDISQECALVQSFWNAVFTSPKPPAPIVSSSVT